MSIETLSSTVPVVASRSQGSASPNRRASQESQPLPVQQPRTQEVSSEQLAQVQARRIARLEQAAEAVFVVSDQRFTIFTDATGQLITRFTSLRDGSVTYVPEPDLLARLESRQSVDPSLSFDA